MLVRVKTVEKNETTQDLFQNWLWYLSSDWISRARGMFIFLRHSHFPLSTTMTDEQHTIWDGPISCFIPPLCRSSLLMLLDSARMVVNTIDKIIFIDWAGEIVAIVLSVFNDEYFNVR
jgi:hypothetical protein